jgi:hypothetical protein
VLVRLPKGLTLAKLRELEKKYLSPLISLPRPVWDTSVEAELGNKPAKESTWLLLATQLMDGTRDKSYISQQKKVASLARRTQVPTEFLLR